MAERQEGRDNNSDTSVDYLAYPFIGSHNMYRCQRKTPELQRVMAQGNGIGGEMSRLDRFEYWVADHTILLIFIFFTFLLLSIAYMPVGFRSSVYPKITEAIKIKESQIEHIKESQIEHIKESQVELDNKIEIIRSMLDGLDKMKAR